MRIDNVKFSRHAQEKIRIDFLLNFNPPKLEAKKICYALEPDVNVKALVIVKPPKNYLKKLKILLILGYKDWANVNFELEDG